MINATVRKVNAWFRNASRADVDSLLSKVILSERQEKIFDMFYIRQKDLGFIADSLCMSYPAAKSELSSIREKILPLL